MVEKLHGKDMPKARFRELCREYAAEQIARQKKDFIRLGVLGDWDNPYLTMDFKTEPILCVCSAKSTNPAISTAARNRFNFVWTAALHWPKPKWNIKTKYRLRLTLPIRLKTLPRLPPHSVWQVSKAKRLLSSGRLRLGLCLRAKLFQLAPDVVYQLIDTPKGKLVLAKDLAEDALKRYGFSDGIAILAETTGDKLENLHMNHPFLERDIPMLNGDHVTTDAGTGLVHTAPAHGLEDYAVCNKYGIELYNPVNAEGKYISETPRVAGMSVWEANPVILQWLEETGNLLASSKIEHSYAHCWRHKTPLIYRATGQWFVGMDKAGKDGKTLRDKAIKAVDDTEFFPSWGRARLEAMIEGRPDWVVSRQRYWGTPMTFFVHKETGELHPNTAELLEKVA